MPGHVRSTPQAELVGESYGLTLLAGFSFIWRVVVPVFFRGEYVCRVVPDDDKARAAIAQFVGDNRQAGFFFYTEQVVEAFQIHNVLARQRHGPAGFDDDARIVTVDPRQFTLVRRPDNLLAEPIHNLAAYRNVVGGFELAGHGGIFGKWNLYICGKCKLPGCLAAGNRLQQRVFWLQTLGVLSAESPLPLNVLRTTASAL